jgi:hypothetical protein
VICRPGPAFAEASLSTDSFISDFLTEVAIRDHHDALRGLKKHVAVGGLISGGTGLAFLRGKKEIEAWEVEEHTSLLQRAKANMTSHSEGSQNAAPAIRVTTHT